MASTTGSRWPTAAIGAACALLAACGGGSGSEGAFGPNACSVANQKDFVLDQAREWYLFRQELPDDVDVDDYESAAELLDALTAGPRADGRDRFFSYLTTVTEDDAFFFQGRFVGFGLRTRIDGDRLFVTDVFEAGPAELGGLVRGTEITHIDAGDGFVPLATILAEDPDLSDAFGPALQGVERGMRFLLPDGQPGEGVFVKQAVTIRPVPVTGRTVLALPANQSVPVGYIHLRAFLPTAEPLLRIAYEEFRAQGIQNFIVDFRYNGGGLVAIADILGDLNGAERDRDDVYSRMIFNDRKSSRNSVHRFDPQPESVAPVRIAFITTQSTASASEHVINAMKPWAEVAIVGTNTFGKPVGQSAFDLGLCDFRLRLVTFRLANTDGESNYYAGLAPALPFACAAEDDLAHVPGDAAEDATAAALSWLGLGACDATIGADTGLQYAQDASRLPRGPPQGSAQAHLPGLY